MRAVTCSWLLALVLAAQAADRSAAVRAEFQRLNPCPSTGKPTGPCPGWERDHKVALCLRGADRVENYQWLTTQAHRAKTRADTAACRWRP